MTSDLGQADKKRNDTSLFQLSVGSWIVAERFSVVKRTMRDSSVPKPAWAGADAMIELQTVQLEAERK